MTVDVEGPAGPPRRGAAPSVRRESWLEQRLRQARNPPPPVLRAVLADLAVAAIGGALLLAYDVAWTRGVVTWGGDLRTALSVAYVAAVVAAGSLLTYLWVELPVPGGPRGEARAARRRSPWAALLGLLAAVPIVYLALVVLFQVVRPAIG